MSNIINNSGVLSYINDRVSIRNIGNMPSEYTEKLIDASSAINNYLQDKNTSIELSPARVNSEDVLCIRANNDLKPEGTLKGFVRYADSEEMPFIRKVYTKIQAFTEHSAPRIEKIKEVTLANLKKLGKIK